MSKLSTYVTLAEGIKSDTAERYGIDNSPNSDQCIFDPCRVFVGGPLHVNSFFRTPALNKLIKGSKTSQHMKGEAIDIDCDQFGNGNNRVLFHFIKDNLEFDQLIWEYGTKENPAWVHASLRRDGKNRRDIRVVDRYGDRPWKP